MAIPWRIVVLVVALSAVACRSTETPDLSFAVAPDDVSAADFPGAAGIVSGFDALANDAEWRAGDEVLYGLRLRRGTHAQHWLLHLRVTEPLAISRQGDEAAPGELLPPLLWAIRINDVPREFRSRRCRVLATVTDAAGTVLGRSEPQLPRDFLQQGFSPACERLRQRFLEHPETIGTDAFYDGMDVGPLAEATVCAIALLQVVQEDSVLAPLLWEVVQRPSFWSVVRNFGARVVLRPRFHAATEASTSLPGLGAHPVWRVPVSLLVNDAPALHADLLVGTTRPPLALAGGMVGAIARHPTDRDLEFSLLLLAARRGPPARAVQLSLAIGRDMALDRR